jgi:hypothetical protein
MCTSPKLIAPFHMLRAMAGSSRRYSPIVPVIGSTTPVT